MIADGEWLYDPRLYHDRLLLGLTGMRSLAELHQLKQRMQAGARHKAERGELRQGLPVGLARGPAGEVIVHPDEEVQARIRLVAGEVPRDPFGQRRDALSAGSELAAASAPQSWPCTPTRVVWQPARTSAILDMLHNRGLCGSVRLWTQAA